ncbi:MAG: hypothetical protein AAF933_16595, partial [Pseudomonadota bacterium]
MDVDPIRAISDRHAAGACSPRESTGGVRVLCATAFMLLSGLGSFQPAAAASGEAPSSDGSREQLIARGAYFRTDAAYVPPPGYTLHHQTAGFAKILCS